MFHAFVGEACPASEIILREAILRKRWLEGTQTLPRSRAHLRGPNEEIVEHEECPVSSL